MTLAIDAVQERRQLELADRHAKSHRCEPCLKHLLERAFATADGEQLKAGHRRTELSHESARGIGCDRNARLRAVAGKAGWDRSIGDGGEAEKVPVHDFLAIDRQEIVDG